MRAAAVLVVPGGVPPGYEAARDWLRERACAAAASVTDRVVVSDGSAEEVHAAFDEFGGPVLVVAADVPRLGEHHLAWALADLAAGATASLGPTFDGGWYIVALATPDVDLPRPVEPAATVLAAAAEQEIEAGLLRMERAVRSTEDVRALLADPLIPAELRHLLDT